MYAKKRIIHRENAKEVYEKKRQQTKNEKIIKILTKIVWFD